MLHGKVVLYTDVSEELNTSFFIKESNCFNVPLMMYSDGSYFGDNEIFLKRRGLR